MKIPICMFLFLGSLAFAQGEAEALLEQILGNLRGDSQRATLSMTVSEEGRESSFELRIYSQGQDRALIRVLAPAREAGQAFLNDGDNLFVYNPRLRRSLRLPPSGRSDSFLGSDLSYNDLAGDDFRSFYTPRLLSEDESGVTLELIPAENAPTPYGKLELTAERPSLAPTGIRYFDQRGEVVKEASLADYAEVDGLYIPTRFEVRDLVRGSRTVLVWRNAEFGLELPEACFSQQALEREGMCE